jgi:predicted TIM-barrel fold metal-dependent hydrolase
MKIDAFTHFLPTEYRSRVMDILRGREDDDARDFEVMLAKDVTLVDLEARFELMDELGEDYRQVLTLASPTLEELGEPALSAELARIGNDELADLVDEHPDRFVGFAAQVQMNDVELGLREIDHAIVERGALGIQIYSSVAGRPLDDPEFEPIFARIAELDSTIWIHPMRLVDVSDYPRAGEERSLYSNYQRLGWPYETSVAMSRLVFSGLMERYPDIKIITHHGGGIIPQCAGRLRDLPFGPEREDVARRLTAEPLDYFRRFYGDTAQFGNAGGMRCAVDFFGADHILFGTDFGFNPQFASGSIADLEAIGLSQDDLQKIFEGNARRVLNLEARLTALS